MTITLQDFSNGDTDYIARHNANNAVLNAAVSALQAAAGASASYANLPHLYAALFGNGPTPNFIDENGFQATIIGQTVSVTAGYVYMPSLLSVCYNSATVAVDLAGLSNGTYYIVMDVNGIPTYNITGIDGIYSVVKTGTSLGSLTTLATNSFDLDAPLSVSHGGTSLVTISQYGVMVGNGTSAVNPIVSSSSGQMFRGAGSGSMPTWSTTTWPNTATATQLVVCLTNNIISGLTSATNGVLVTSNSGAGVPSILAGPGATGRVLTSNSAAAPSWSTATFPGTAGGTGTFLRSDGTNWVASTLTVPNTAAISTLLYASSANVISELATANSGVLVTSAGGVPSIATDIPTAVTIGTAYVYRVGGTDVSVADGGTGLSTLTIHALYVGNGASAPTALAVGGTGSYLRGASGADPVWSTLTLPNTAAVSTILYASATDVISALATANEALLVTSATGVPSLSTTPLLNGSLTVRGSTGILLYVGPTTGSFNANIQSYLLGCTTNAVLNNSASTFAGFVGAYQDNGTGSCAGVYGVAQSTHTAGSRGHMDGMSGDVYHSGAGGTISVYVAGVSGFASASAGTVAVTCSFYAWTNGGGGTVAINAGLYIDNQAGVATANYAWYYAGAGASTSAYVDSVGSGFLNGLTMGDATNIILNTTTGTKIGTATTQKLGFYNATPVVQGASVADATDAATAITQLNALISRIEATGLIATV